MSGLISNRLTNHSQLVKNNFENHENTHIKNVSQSSKINGKKLGLIAAISLVSLLGIAAGCFTYAKFSKSSKEIIHKVSIESKDNIPFYCLETIMSHRLDTSTSRNRIIPIKKWLCHEDNTLVWRTKEVIQAFKGPGTLVHFNGMIERWV